ncbi:hypothetical protein ABFX02_13G022300 [Erythranthe guttata]
MKRACELCEKMARIRCEADDASLCWDCDAKVHAANFLVARHSRNLLCHVCQSPTPWSASGAKVGPAVSFCLKCSDSRIRDGGDEEAPATAAAEAAEEEEERDEKEMENQVVPWSPPESSSTSKNSDGGDGGEAVDSRKRCRHDEFFSSNHPSYDNNGCSKTPSGNIQKTDPGRVGVRESPAKRFCREKAGSGTETPEIHTFDLNSPPSDVDVDLSTHQQI